MQSIELNEVEHSVKIGQQCPKIKPNVTKDTVLTFCGEPVGLYLKNTPKKFQEIAAIANTELRSKRVPKSVMSRVQPDGEDSKGKKKYKRIQQYSAILGSCAPKPHLKRPYPTISSVHSHQSAQNFVKAMVLLARESESIIKKYLPDQYEHQLKLMEDVPESWRFTDLFTSSISNYNINADYHLDTANIKETVNVIITKRYKSSGGCLHVPDYDLCFEQSDSSILIYPAWKNVHGVTPIETKSKYGYRNSLIFYPLKAFVKETPKPEA